MQAKTMDRSVELVQYKKELADELRSMLQWWTEHAVDIEQGGFYGTIDNNNIPGLSAPKGIVLNSRILWTFSAAYIRSAQFLYLQMATRAFEYILAHFTDHEFGGVFWSVDQYGKMLDGRKQVYGQAFCIYGMAEYFKATGEEKALQFAKRLYENIERYSADKNRGGYTEAFTREWQEAKDLRLSEKDDNEKKTMNTHLHIIEAYANLYTAWPDKLLKEKVADLLEIFDKHFINKETYHLDLFFDENWQLRSSLRSFGHDIEAAWLLQYCAEIIKDEKYVDRFKQLAVLITDAAAEAVDSDGGLWYEYEPQNDHLVKEKHSWPQAEAMIGFFNAYQLTGEEAYLHRSLQSWEFIKKSIIDKNKGEWFWGIDEKGMVMQKEKAGFWKCPYHGSRACIEIIKRVGN